MSSVVAYANDERRCFCQIRFDTAERVLISIASAPTPSVKVLRLALGGLIPRQTIWEYNPTMAGGYNAYVEKMMKMFPPSPAGPVHPLDVIRDTLLGCTSLNEARRKLLECESRVAVASPQMPESSTPFDQVLLALANRVRAEIGFTKCEGFTDAAAIVLTKIITSTLAEAGADHLPHPTASSTDNASVGACFMAACLTGLSTRLNELGIELDAREVFTRAGFAVFQMYHEEDQARILSAGGNTFKKLVAETTNRQNLRTWLEGVQTFTAAFVLTGDKAWVAQLVKLYCTLASARE